MNNQFELKLQSRRYKTGLTFSNYSILFINFKIYLKISVKLYTVQ